MIEEPRPGLGDEAAHHAAYLDFYRSSVIEAVLALPEEERRRGQVPSGWTPIELLSHVLHMEQRWFVWGFLGEVVEQPWGDWTTDEPWEQDTSGRWHVDDAIAAEELATRLRAVGARTRTVLCEHALEARASPTGRFAEDPPELRWICFHVLQEYARHAGHLDIVIEIGPASP